VSWGSKGLYSSGTVTVEEEIKENSNYVNEVSVSCAEFEAKMVAWGEVVAVCAEQVDREKDSAN